MQIMKMAGTFSKTARQAGEPIVSTVIVKGNRMTRIGQQQTEIIDLDRETVTSIDHQKRQYTVMTFEQMRQQIEKAMQKAKESRRSRRKLPSRTRTLLRIRTSSSTCMCAIPEPQKMSPA